MRDLGIDVRIKLKYMLKQQDRGCGFDSTGPEHGDENVRFQVPHGGDCETVHFLCRFLGLFFDPDERDSMFF
jgi:hypothetical protein